MRGQNRNEAFVLKHRLAGAAILIGFAVVVLPMLLGGPDPAVETQGNAVDVNSDPDTKVFQSNIKPIGGEIPSPEERAVGQDDTEPAGVVESPPSPPVDDSGAEATAAADESVKEEKAPAQASTGSDGGDAPADNGTGTETTATIERGWIVQVGTFRNAANVEKLVAKLESNGFGSSTTEVETSAGPATRVWVGPFQTRVEAARMKTRVKQRTGSEGLIVAYP